MASDTSAYDKNVSINTKEWKKRKYEMKQQRRKWREEKLLKKLEKEKEIENSKQIKQENKTNERPSCPTISIALPGSILDNAQSVELRTYLAGQIARAAVVFCVDEVIIFDETGNTDRNIEGQFEGIKKGSANVQLARVLQYLECPQYLRKSFFPQHRDLQYAGLLNPLDTPHHMRAADQCIYREGVVLDKPVKKGRGSYVNVGLDKVEVQIDKLIQPGVRVTVKLDTSDITDKKKITGKVVSPKTPRLEAGKYWGYSVRVVASLSSVFTGCPYEGGYDMTIGTSERGMLVDDFEDQSFKHCLVVFGGVKGLEASLEADEALDIQDPALLFQHYLNTCPGQGSGTIRTEEAILITMSALRPKLNLNCKIEL